MSNFFRRLTDIAKAEKKDPSPKPAITPEILSDYFRTFNRSDTHSKSLLEDSETSNLNLSGRINGNGDETKDDDERLAGQVGRQRLAKSSFSSISEAKLQAKTPSPKSRGTDYFSDILASARESIRHDLETTKSTTPVAHQRSDVSGNAIDRIGFVREPSMNGDDDLSEKNNNDNNLVQHGLIPDDAGRRNEHLHLSPDTPYYLPQATKDKSTDSNNSEHVITINIGRIEIHASREEKRLRRRVEEQQRQQKFQPLSLSEYLQKRSGEKQ
jgi:hypothetical protein